jgi:hypothetical protein
MPGSFDFRRIAPAIQNARNPGIERTFPLPARFGRIKPL